MKNLILLFAMFLFAAGATSAQDSKSDRAGGNSAQIELLSGATSVALSADFVNALTSLNIAPDRVFPANLSHGRISFPITDGTLEAQSLRGEIIHNGGLTLTRGSTEVKLKSFFIDTTGSSIILTGLVSADGSVVGRIPLFDLQLASSFDGSSLRFRRVSLENVIVTLRPEAAGALNAVFETSAFVPGFNIGTARLRGYGYRD